MYGKQELCRPKVSLNSSRLREFSEGSGHGQDVIEVLRLSSNKRDSRGNLRRCTEIASNTLALQNGNVAKKKKIAKLESYTHCSDTCFFFVLF